MAAGNEMRVSDAERDAAATGLREHFASGRLNQDELDQRLTAVFAAKTRGELNALFTDLPSGPGVSGAGASGGQPFGAGMFGARGPLGPSGPLGAGGRWSGATGDGDGWGSRGGDWRGGRGRDRDRDRGPGRMLSRVIVSSVLLWVLLIVGVLGVFGIGTGRPIGIVLIVAAFALLRRLLFIIFGRRRVGRGGGRGRGGRGRGRRWS